MRRYVTLAAVALAVVFALSYAIPALGGPQAVSSASPLSVAKKALKSAKKADRNAKKAQTAANQALAGLNKKSGFLVANVQTVSTTTTIPAGGVGAGTANCPAGTTVISGGYTLTGTESSTFFDRRSGNGWTIGVDNIISGAPSDLTVDAQCVAGGNAVTAARVSADRARDRRLVEARRQAHQR